MTDAPNYPRVAQLRDVAAFRERLAELGQSLPDRRRSPLRRSRLAARRTDQGRQFHRRQSLVHPSDGRLGRQSRRLALRAHAPPLAKLRPQRREAHLGRRSGRRPTRWPSQPQPNARHRRQSRRPRRTAARAANRPSRIASARSTASSSACNSPTPAASASRTTTPASSRASPTTIRCSTPSSRSIRNDNSIVWTDAEIEALIDDFVAAAHLAHDVGYQFVDVKACHGYLLHEFLSARRRPGKFGGDLAGRSRLMRTIIERIHDELPQLADRRPAQRVRLGPLRQRPRTRPADGLRRRCSPTTSASASSADDPLRSISPSRSS